jgi:hypothetical protein
LSRDKVVSGPRVRVLLACRKLVGEVQHQLNRYANNARFILIGTRRGLLVLTRDLIRIFASAGTPHLDAACPNATVLALQVVGSQSLHRYRHSGPQLPVDSL